jgi:beta-glucosidase-like glycosyl hydrolase
MQNYYQFIIPRLNGGEIRRKFPFYRTLVKKGIAGFIVFGGELKTLRKYLTALQRESELPLIISSDLERGLGQQVKGGTLFPPAMALASAVKSSQQSAVSSQSLKLLRSCFRAVAVEAKYAGINTIFAPVLDVNTNPLNPIISVRAFGEDPEKVSFFGGEMIREIQGRGIAACGKHFPGHGDTAVDSHLRLPVVNKSLMNLRTQELLPFQRAIDERVNMIMLGHLKVPALDRSGTPVSLSKKAIDFLRNEMKFNGIVITDAMDMGGIGAFSEEQAAFKALRAGVDVLLHPTEPEKIVSYLESKNIMFNPERLNLFRRGLLRRPPEAVPRFRLHRRISDLLTARAISLTADFHIKGELVLIILNDDEQEKGSALADALRRKVPSLTIHTIRKGKDIRKIRVPVSSFLAIAVFAETKAWKGGASSWLFQQLAYIAHRTDLSITFGSPYLFHHVQGLVDNAELFAYWDSEAAQRAVAGIIGKKASAFQKH